MKNKTIKTILMFTILLLSMSFTSGELVDNFNRENNTIIGEANNTNTWVETGSLWELKDGKLFINNTPNVQEDVQIELVNKNPSRIDYSISYGEDCNTPTYQKFGEGIGLSVTDYAINLNIKDIGNGCEIIYREQVNNPFPTNALLNINTIYNISLRNIDYTNDNFSLYIDETNYGEGLFYKDDNIDYVSFERRGGTTTIDCLTTEGSECEPRIPYYQFDDGRNYTYVKVNGLIEGEELIVSILNNDTYTPKPFNVFPTYDDFEDGVVDTNKWYCEADCNETNTTGNLLIKNVEVGSSVLDKYRVITKDKYLKPTYISKMSYNDIFQSTQVGNYFGLAQDENNQAPVIDDNFILYASRFHDSSDDVMRIRSTINDIGEFQNDYLYPSGHTTTDTGYFWSAIRTNGTLVEFYNTLYENHKFVNETLSTSIPEPLGFSATHYGTIVSTYILLDEVALYNNQDDKINYTCVDGECSIIATENLTDVVLRIPNSLQGQDLNIEFNLPPENFLNITNITILPEGNITTEDLEGICVAEDLYGSNITYSYEWEINNDLILDNVLSPNSFSQGSGGSNYKNTTFNMTTDQLDDFLYNPSVTRQCPTSICGTNYKITICNQSVQDGLGVFHVNYGIPQWSSEGSFPINITQECIVDGNVEVNLETHIAYFTTPPTASVIFEESNTPLNDTILSNSYLSSGDFIEFTCFATIVGDNDTKSVNKTIVFDEIPPSQVIVYLPNESVTLNSSGIDLTFDYTSSIGFPIPTYNVYLTNGIYNATIRTNTPYTNFVESVSSSDVLIGGTYFVGVESVNPYGNEVSLSHHNITICLNNWVSSSTTCVEDEQVITWSDINNCPISYDRPINHNTTITCDDGIYSELELANKEVELKENWLILGLLTLLLGIGILIRVSNERFFPVSVTIFVLVGIALWVTFPSYAFVGIIIMSIGGLDLLFSLSSRR